MPDPIRPATIPADLREIASQAFILTTGSDQERLGAAVAAVLNEAREQIAQWVEGDRVLTNEEMTALDRTDDAGEVYVSYAARMIRAWPQGYGARPEEAAIDA
jgi:hypothetical protein